jgi:hypothetical protein
VPQTAIANAAENERILLMAIDLNCVLAVDIYVLLYQAPFYDRETDVLLARFIPKGSEHFSRSGLGHRTAWLVYAHPAALPTLAAVEGKNLHDKKNKTQAWYG